MSFAFITVMALMCSSVVIAFVLQTGQEDAIPLDSDSRCRGLSLQSLRKELLAALNLQTEPRLPEGAKEQWSGTAERLKALEASSNSSSDDGGDTSGCCSRTSEVLMSDLGWDNWMIYPERVTLVHCAPCGHSASCRPQPTATQRDDLEVQAPCCQPIAQNPMPVMYRDEWNTMVITSMHLTRRCGCLAALQPSQE
ncbi:bone morphogenetic protein 7-like isoform X2 [Syngnathus typhle]|uniref:bone morphogenetic protein 7-like isoform X2 n=1 Tax=Syngnathus typhle TaxID=161592 RepID=UPI002A6ADCA0|nr:bone morphogenetic protein 7-like isoform X2 [Syngnathus typhle]